LVTSSLTRSSAVAKLGSPVRTIRMSPTWKVAPEICTRKGSLIWQDLAWISAV
jgi:hypothetical protein